MTKESCYYIANYILCIKERKRKKKREKDKERKQPTLRDINKRLMDERNEVG